MTFVFACDECGKVCKSKAGLTIHVKRMHEKSEQKKNFVCEKCSKNFSQDANLKNHEKICTGFEEDGKKTCSTCQKKYSTTYIARHMRACKAARGGDTEVVAQPRARVYKAKRKNCPGCGAEMAATNVARHLREVCHR